MSAQGRTLPQLGPVLVLYLAIELFSSGSRLDPAALVLAAFGLTAALLPLVIGRFEEREGTRRLAAISTLAAIGLLAIAQPGVLSLPLELAAAIAWPPIGSLAIDLALDTPDRPPGLARAGGLRTIAHLLAIASAATGAIVVLPAFELGGDAIVAPTSLSAIPPLLLLAQLLVALAARIARRRLGSTPEALASNGWALLGIAGAAAALLAAAIMVGAGVLDRGAPAIRGLCAAGAASVLLGHLAMIDARRPIHAARGSRRVIAASLACAVLGTAIGWVHDRLPEDPIALGVTAVALLASGALLDRISRAIVDAIFAPDGGRLLRAIEEAERGMVGARTLEEVAAGVLAPLRRAARSHESRPLLQTIQPARQAIVDVAGMPRIEARDLSPAILARLSERPGEVVVLAPLRAVMVRRPDLRSLIEALEQLEALCVVPIAVSGELEGALVVAAGRRRAPMTLEEIAALERLAARLAGPLAMHQVEARAQERAGKAILAAERLEERVDALEDELARLRAEAKVWKAGRAADRVGAPAIAYSSSMRALLARVSEVAPAAAPVQVIAEGGNAIDQIGYLVHAASAAREGPLVIADCAAIRPERSIAALFGDEGESGPHPGWLRLASGGTLLLIDAPALSLEAQAALAEAIASRQARAEAGASSYPVEARVIAHTRMDLATLARVSAFDVELSRRLEPLRLELPSLRDRREDLPSLVLYALDRGCRALGREVLGIDERALARLLAYDWPGNLRELESVIERAVLAAKPPRILEADLPALSGSGDAPMLDPLDGTWTEIEHRILRAALEKANGNKSEAARLLGLKRTTFLDKLRRAGFEVRDSLPPSA